MRDSINDQGVDISDVKPAYVLQALYAQARAKFPFAQDKTLSLATAEQALASQSQFDVFMGKKLAVRFDPGKLVFLTDHSSAAGTAYHDYNGPKAASIALTQARAHQREAEIGSSTGFAPVVIENKSPTRPAAFAPAKGTGNDNIFIVK